MAPGNGSRAQRTFRPGTPSTKAAHAAEAELLDRFALARRQHGNRCMQLFCALQAFGGSTGVIGVGVIGQRELIVQLATVTVTRLGGRHPCRPTPVWRFDSIGSGGFGAHASKPTRRWEFATLRDHGTAGGRDIGHGHPVRELPRQIRCIRRRSYLVNDGCTPATRLLPPRPHDESLHVAARRMIR